MSNVPNPIIVDAAGTAGSGYVLKAYLPGTTTSTSIAIDSSGSSPQASLTANAEGIWEVSGNEILPYIDRKHKWGIFANATDAAANTPFYMGPFDNVEQVLEAGASNIPFTQSGTGAVESTVNIKLNEIVSVKDFGADSTATAADNLAAFNSAIASVETGGKLVVPVDASFYSIDISGGRSAAIIVNKKIHIQIEGSIKATAGAAIEANPAAIFNVSADGVTFSGGGSIIGDGTVDSTNAGTSATIPTLVYVSGDNFTFTGITIDTPYKSGIHLNSCNHANIHNARFTGGPTEYSDTAYFAVRADGGGRHAFVNNELYPDASGGMYVNCLFLVSDNCLVQGNIVYLPYEKLAYITGSGNKVDDNIVIGNSGTIPGTNQEGTVGVVIRCDGSNNKITNNLTEYGGGAACRLGGGNDISDNQFLNAGSTALGSFAATSSLDNTTIRNNTVTNGSLAGIVVASGLLITGGNFSNKRIEISGNIIEGFGIADPVANLATWATSTVYPAVSLVKPETPSAYYYSTTTGGTSGGTTPVHTSGTVSDGGVDWTAVGYTSTNASIQMDATGGSTYDDCSITHNNLTGGYRGIATNDLNTSNISDNIVVATNAAFREDTGATNQYRFNYASAPTEYEGLSTTSPVLSYSVGDWVPVISDGTNNATMGTTSTNDGKYTRIGRQVTVTGNCASTALGSVSGAIRITGLPFTSSSGAGSTAGMAVSFQGGLAITAGHSVVGYLAPATDYIALYVTDATTGTTTMSHTEWSDDGNIAFSMTYFV